MLMRRAEESWCSLLLEKGSKWQRRDSNPGSLAQCLPLNHNDVMVIVSDPEVPLPNINPGVTPKEAKKKLVQECLLQSCLQE